MLNSEIIHYYQRFIRGNFRRGKIDVCWTQILNNDNRASSRLFHSRLLRGRQRLYPDNRKKKKFWLFLSLGVSQLLQLHLSRGLGFHPCSSCSCPACVGQLQSATNPDSLPLHSSPSSPLFFSFLLFLFFFLFSQFWQEDPDCRWSESLVAACFNVAPRVYLKRLLMQ